MKNKRIWVFYLFSSTYSIFSLSITESGIILLVIQIRNGRTITSSKIPKKGIISFIKSAGIAAYKIVPSPKSFASFGVFLSFLAVAKRAIDEFLKDNEMEVYLSTFGKDILSLIM